MKTIVLLLLLNIAGYSQVFVAGFESDAATANLSLSMAKMLSEQLSKDYYVVSAYTGNQSEKSAFTQIEEYFQSKLGYRFSFEKYKLTAGITRSAGYTYLYNVKIALFSSEKGLIFSLTKRFLQDKDSLLFASNVYELLKSKLPCYFSINKIQDASHLIIDDKSGNEYASYELINTDNAIAGYARVSEKYPGSLNLIYSMHDGSVLAEKDLGNLYIRAFIKHQDDKSVNDNINKLIKKEAADISEEKTNLDIETNENQLKSAQEKEDEERYRSRLETRKNDWVIISLQNYAFGTQGIGRYLNNPLVSLSNPVVLCAQFNFNKTDSRFFTKLRYSTPSNELSSQEPINGTDYAKTSKATLWEAGIGIENKFFIYNTVHPGIGFVINYVGLYSENNYSAYNTAPEKDRIYMDDAKNKWYHGLDIEFVADISIRLARLGLYSELTYHYIPLLKSGTNNFKSNGLAIGVGAAYFFD